MLKRSELRALARTTAVSMSENAASSLAAHTCIAHLHWLANSLEACKPIRNKRILGFNKKNKSE